MKGSVGFGGGTESEIFTNVPLKLQVAPLLKDTLKE